MAVDSLLTKTYREVLENEPVTGQKARQDRMRMRKRATQGLHDCAKLSQYARGDDIKRIFQRDDTDRREYEQQPDERRELSKAHWIPAMHMVSFLWRGLRENGMDKQDVFKKAIRDGIVWGEADYKEVDMGNIEQDMSLNKLEAHTQTDELDPLEKWNRDLALTGDEYQEINDRLSEHPEVDQIAPEDLGELIEKYLLEGNESTD